MSTPSPNHPCYTSRVGSVQLTVWANKQTSGNVSYSVYLLRSYRVPTEKRDGADDDGWRKTNSLRNEDLLAAAEMLRLAFARISVQELPDHHHEEEA